MVLVELVWKAQFSGIPRFSFDPSFHCRHLIDLECSRCQTAVNDVSIPCGNEGAVSNKREQRNDPDFSIKCKECHSINTITFVKDAFPKELFKVLEDSEETWELEKTVLQLDCRGLIPHKYHCAKSGPYFVEFGPTSSLSVEWSKSDDCSNSKEALWEWYDVHPILGHPVSVTTFSASFRKA